MCSGIGFTLVLVWCRCGWGSPFLTPFPSFLSHCVRPSSGLGCTSLLITCRHSALDHDKLRQCPSQMTAGNSGTSGPPEPPTWDYKIPGKEPAPHGSPGIFSWKGRGGHPRLCSEPPGAHHQTRVPCALWGPFVSAGKLCFGLSQTHPPVTSSHSWAFLSRKREQDCFWSVSFGSFIT